MNNLYNFIILHKELKLLYNEKNFDEKYNCMFSDYINGKLRIIIQHSLHDEMLNNFKLEKNIIDICIFKEMNVLFWTYFH